MVELAGLHCPVMICHQPGASGWIIGESWDQVEVQMGSTLTKGDGIDAITAGDLLHHLTGIAHG